MNEIDDTLELLRELNIWELEEAFAEINSLYLEECNNVMIATFGELK